MAGPSHPSIHLRSVSLKKAAQLPGAFPFSLPLVRTLETLAFPSPVTIFAGENGSGKSTLMEAIAAAASLPIVGGERIQTDHSLEHARALAAHMRLAWSKRTHRGFFLRAEDFFRFARRMNELGKELENEAQRYSGDSYGDMLARGSLLGQRAGLVKRYGENLDARSHGESFLKLFEARFVPDGLYLLDEPEAPLSPLRQLGFLSMMKEMVADRGAQFIIATHSPILMAFPGAAIISFDALPLRQVPFDSLEHVALMRSFLTDPDQYLRRL